MWGSEVPFPSIPWIYGNKLENAKVKKWEVTGYASETSEKSFLIVEVEND